MLGEANFSDHGANRLGASALMQGLADGYFVIPYTLAHYLAARSLPAVTTDTRRLQRAPRRPCRSGSIASWPSRATERRASSTASWARVLWDDVGMSRTDAGPAQGADAGSAAARGVLAERVGRPGGPSNLNKNLEYAGRVADYLEFAEVLTLDALRPRPNPAAATSARRARRPTARRCGTTGASRYVAAWEFTGVGRPPTLHQEPLDVRVRQPHAAELQVERKV